MKNQEAQTKVDFTSQIEEVVFNYSIQESDGTVTPVSSKTLEGTISVLEQRILYKRNPITGSIACTVTDFKDLIDYNVKFTEREVYLEGMSYRVRCTKKSNPSHWVDLDLCIGYMEPGQAFVETYHYGNDPTFDYSDISEALECWAQDNLWK